MSELSASALGLLESAKFAHLATCDPTTNQPNVSLMNYVYLKENQLFKKHQELLKNDSINSFIIFSVNKNATNFKNIKKNPKVSILIHDWITAKSLSNSNNQNNSLISDDSPLLQIIQNMNQSEISDLSITLNGEAILIEDDLKADEYYKEKLLKDYSDSKVFISGSNNLIILIKIQHLKIVDNEGKTMSS